MDKEPLIDFICRTLSPGTFQVSRQLLETIVGHFEPQTFARNELFVAEGKVNRHHFFMTTGFMRAFVHTPEGQEVTTDFFPANSHIFEADSFVNQARSMENIEALVDCKGFVLSFENSNTLFHRVPEFREFGRRILVKAFAAHKKRSLSLIYQTAEQRYADLVNGHQEVFQYAQLKHIASYLGITDSSLSRIRKEFSRKK